MINLTAMSRLAWVSLAFLILVNLLVLGRALYNRLPPALAQITLSERELELPYRYGANRENSAVNLQLRWRTLAVQGEETNWSFNRSLSLPAEQFAQLQFANCDTDAPRKMQRRQGWVLLELNGPAYTRYWQAAEAELAQHRAKQPDAANKGDWQQTSRDLQSSLADAKHNDSRLFALAASVQRHTLTQQLAAQQQANAQASYLILPAEIRDSYARCSAYLDSAYTADQRVANATRVDIHLQTGDVLHVANQHTAPVLAKERYQAVLSLGRLNELWLHSLQP